MTPASLSASTSDRPDPLLLAFGFMLRRSLWLCLGLIVLPAVYSGIHSVSLSRPGDVLILNSLIFFVPVGLVGKRAAGFARNAYWLLPLGHRRTTIFLWLWRVPMGPFLACLFSVPFYLWRDGHFLSGSLDYAQHWLWAAGVLAVLTWVGNLRRTWVTTVFWLTAVVFVFSLHAGVGVTLASGEYDLALNLLSTATLSLSFWALRFQTREETPLTEQAAARHLELNGGKGAWILSFLSGWIGVDRLSGHWLPQLLARCLLSTSSLFIVVLIVLVHHGCALAPRTYASRYDWYLIILIVFWLTPADPRALRRLPLSASMIAALTVFLTLFAAAFFTLPTFAFQRVPGSLGVEFFLPHLFSLQALGSVVAYAGLIMVCWMLWICFPRLSGVRSGWAYVLWGLPLLVVGFMMHELHAEYGWRSDLVVGGFLLLGSATLYGILLRRGHRLYNPAKKGLW
jgi:hypothetical protein